MARKIVWILFILSTALWSGLAALAAQLLDWSLAFLNSGGSLDLGGQVQALPLPEWLVLFMDPEGARQLLAALGGFIQGFLEWLPGLQSWVGALIWIVWGLGFGLLLTLALLGHWLSGLLQAPPSPPRPSTP